MDVERNYQFMVYIQHWLRTLRDEQIITAHVVILWNTDTDSCEK